MRRAAGAIAKTRAESYLAQIFAAPADFRDCDYRVISDRQNRDGVLERSDSTVQKCAHCPELDSGLAPDLIECVHSGCDLAVSGLLHRARGIAERSVWLHSAADRDDIVQRTWIVVWQNLTDPNGSASFRDEGSFEGWVRAIARNQARGLIRHQGRKSAPVLGVDSATAKSERFTSAAVTDMSLAAAVSALPDVEYEPYVLREIVGLSHSEIAERTRVSPATTKRRIRSARSRVQRRLDSGSPGDG